MLRRKTNFFSTEECLEFYNICIRDTSFPSHPEIHPPHAELRFAVGDEVSCNCSPWQTGRVLNSPYFEMGQEFPYQVMIGLEKVVKVPFDGDGVITSHFVTPASARVRLIQLNTKSLNGKCGSRGKLNKKTGRYTVTLEDGQRIGIKPENMEIISTSATSEGTRGGTRGKNKSKKRKGKSQLISETRTAEAAQSEQDAAQSTREFTHTPTQVWHEVVTSAYFDDAGYQQHLFLQPSDALVWSCEDFDPVPLMEDGVLPCHSSLHPLLHFSQGTFPDTWQHPLVSSIEQEEWEDNRHKLNLATYLLIIMILVPMNYQEGIDPTPNQVQFFQINDLRDGVHLVLGMCRQRQFWDPRTGPLEFAKDFIYNVYKILRAVAEARAKENKEKQLLTFEETRHLIALHSLCMAETTRANLAHSDRREWVSEYAFELACEQIAVLLYDPLFSGEETFMCIVDYLEKSLLKSATPSQSVGRGGLVSICITLLNNGDETAGFSKPVKHPTWVHVEKHIVPFVKAIAGILDQQTIDVDTGSHLLGACCEILAKPQFHRGGSIASLLLPSCRRILRHGKYSPRHMRWEQQGYADLLIAAGIGKAGGFVNTYSPKVYEAYLMAEWNNQSCASRTLIIPCQCRCNLPSRYCTYQKIIRAEERTIKNHRLAEKKLLKKKYRKANRLAMKSYSDIEENWERYNGVKGSDRRSMLEKSRYLMGEAHLGLGDYSESIARFMEVLKNISFERGNVSSVVKFKSLLSGARAQLAFSKVQKHTKKKKSLVQDAHEWLACLVASAGNVPVNFWTYNVDAVSNTAGKGFYKNDHVEFSEWTTNFYVWNHRVRMEWDDIGGGEDGFNAMVQQATQLLGAEKNTPGDDRNTECEDNEDSESTIAMRAAPAVAAPCRVYTKTWRSVGSIANAEGEMDTSMYICERLNLSIQWVRDELLIWNYGLKEVVCWINTFPPVLSSLNTRSHRFCAWDTSKSSSGNGSGTGSGVAVLCMFTMEREPVLFLDFLVAALKPKTDEPKTNTTLYGTHMSWHQVSEISSDAQGFVETVVQHPNEKEFIISFATFCNHFGASNFLATHCSAQHSSWSLARQPAGSLSVHIYKGKDSVRENSPFGPIDFVATDIGNDREQRERILSNCFLGNNTNVLTPTLVVDAGYQHIDSILAIEFCDGNDDILCTSSHDRVVKVWNIALGQEDNVAHCLHSFRFDDPAVNVSNRPLCFIIACTPDLLFCAPHVANYRFFKGQNELEKVVTYDTMHGGTNRAVVCWSIKDGSIVAALDSTHASKKLTPLSWNSKEPLGMAPPTTGFDDSVEAIVTVHRNSQVIIGHKTGEINIWKIIKHADPVDHNKEVIQLQHMRGLQVMEHGNRLGMTLSLSKYSLETFPNLIVANGHGFVALVDPGGGICNKDDTWVSFSLMELCDREDSEMKKTSILQVSSLNCGQLMNCGACLVWGLDTKKCSRCKKVCFCNTKCMRKAWKEHKKVCVKAAVKGGSK